MGNQLASSQQPDYNNLPDIGSALTFQERLGGGRFLKTLKCVNEDGILVVKVYFKRDPGLSLASYEEMLTEVRRRRRRRRGAAPPLPPRRHRHCLHRHCCHRHCRHYRAAPPTRLSVVRGSRVGARRALHAMPQLYHACRCALSSPSTARPT